MDKSTPYREAMHQAATADEVAELLRRFMESLDSHETVSLGMSAYAIARFTDTFIGQLALRAARDELMTKENDPRLAVVSEVGRVLSTAALRLSVLEMDARNSRARASWLQRGR